MNKLDLVTGAVNHGMPLHAADLAFMQSGLREAIDGLVFGFLKSDSQADQKAILNDITVADSGTEITVSATYVVIDGEMFKLGGALISTTSGLSAYGIYIDESFDPVGSDVFADQISRDTYKIRKALVLPTTGPNAGTGSYIPLADYKDYIINVCNSESSTLLVDTAARKLTLYRRNNVVHLQGYFTDFNTPQVEEYTIPTHLWEQF